jgi:hypothetical protein
MTDKETGDDGTHQPMMIDNPVDGGVAAEDVAAIAANEPNQDRGGDIEYNDLDGIRFT